MTDNLFDDNNNTNNALESLVGEGKKFKDLDALARAKLESDDYIKTLETKLDELKEDFLKQREEINAGKTLQEMLDQAQLTRQQDSTRETPPLNSNDTPKPPALDAKQLELLVTSKIQEHESTRQQTENYNTVLSQVREHYGENYQSVLEQQMDELGLTRDLVNNLARNHPKALLKTLGIDGPKTREGFQAPPRSMVFAPKGEEKRTWSYYQKIRKENPDLYYSPKLTAQRHADRIALGDSFKDGDYESTISM